MKDLSIFVVTYNSEKNISDVLDSINFVFPNYLILEKSIIDDYSKDKTIEIAKNKGFNIIFNKYGGVSGAFNTILENVKTKYFAVFEHDIILNKKWLSIYNCLKNSGNNISVIQGVRIPSNKYLKELYLNDKRYENFYSMDNTCFKTSHVKNFKYPVDNMFYSDLFLRKWLNNKGFKWIVFNHIVSIHLRKSVINEKKHELFMMSIINNRKYINDFKTFSSLGIKRLFLNIKIVNVYPLMFIIYLFNIVSSFWIWIIRKMINKINNW